MRTSILIAASVAALSSAPALAQDEIREPQIPPSLEGSIATSEGVYTSSQLAGETGETGETDDEEGYDDAPLPRAGSPVYRGPVDEGVVIIGGQDEDAGETEGERPLDTDAGSGVDFTTDPQVSGEGADPVTRDGVGFTGGSGARPNPEVNTESGVSFSGSS